MFADHCMARLQGEHLDQGWVVRSRLDSWGRARQRFNGGAVQWEECQFWSQADLMFQPFL